MASENEDQKEDAYDHEDSLDRVICAIGHMNHKLDDLSSRLNDTYGILRDISQAVEHDNGVSMQDLYEDEYSLD